MNGDGVDADGLVERLFSEALTTEWGVLALLCAANLGFVTRDRRRMHRLLEASLHHWPTFEALGARFTNNGLAAQPIWQVPNGIHYIVGGLGVPEEELSLDATTGPYDVLRFLRND